MGDRRDVGARRPMALRAVITVDIDAVDFIEAAEQQADLLKVIEPLKQEFPGTHLKIIERRSRRAGLGVSSAPQADAPQSGSGPNPS